MSKSDQDYIGRGISFPLRVSVQGGLKIDGGDRNLEESIATILNTKLGERVYRPNFGSRLADLTFAPMNPQTILLARVYVEEALNRWEPRIKVTGVYAEPDPIKGRLDLKILYRLKDGHDTRSMVYPFYLLPPSEK
ncbi:GPW/gp25 family protein [Pseudanabaena yagii]|jgi:phage baseplate assembly protein W|uniref:GPW/gp25 family protein n=1 Tax=Pseudanabaena yagii GIHE-NHR1 TaxID=2722753 RepID=A0ABX1LWU9_9CYAN|nr:GPW/gp25 family protein [Pseudanabaena yagii]NMF59698.1 GPW/gp25 family protein [Pseudanabaena yagii GIHE-NHR1]